MLVIFDLDGTLFQTANCAISAVNTLAEELGIPAVSNELVKENIGKKSDEFLKTVFSKNTIANKIIKRYRELEQKEVEENGSLFTDIVQMLELLELRGYKLCICSNGSMEYINLVLDKTGIHKFFDQKYSAKEFASKAIAIENIIKTERQAIMVGDTISDFDAAMMNHIPSVGVLYGYGKKEDVLSATFSTTEVLDIVSLVVTCDVFYQINRKVLESNHNTIGINGVDTSGKTTFANRYSKFLSSINVKNIVVHLDDFHNTSHLRRQGKDEIDAYYNNAFNYTMLIEEILLPLKENGYVKKDIACLNLDTDKYDKTIHISIDSDTTLILEGVLLFRPPILEYLDKKIFIDIDFDEVMRRAVIRDVPKYGESFLEKYVNKYIPIQKRYFKEFSPLEIANIIVDNSDFRYPTFV